MLRTASRILTQHLQLRGRQPTWSQVTCGFSGLVEVSEEVSQAVHSNDAVVALETTIVTHGMPSPDNLQVALEVEQIVRDTGAVPATVAVLEGVLHVGLSQQQLTQVADYPAPCKVSRRDLAYALSQKLTGGTTVSGTMIAAHLAGIHLFVTGGIGGVHRGAETTFDISADLTELGKTPVAVVSAGVKSILDIEKTLEYLETQGVFVGTYGTDTFPSFFTADSGYKSPHYFDNVADIARTIACNLSLGLKSGMLIGVPLPKQFEASGDLIQSTIEQAVLEASEKCVKGKAVTPFVLGRVNELTGGQSLESNKRLIQNNAAVGSQIAVQLSKIKKNSSSILGQAMNQQPSFTQWRSYSQWGFKSGRPVVVGGLVVDFVITAESDKIQFQGATYPGSVRQSFGGVARNVADGLSRLECNPLLISVIGDDIQSEAFRHYASHMDLRGIKCIENHSTPSYYAILDKSGELMFGVGDMHLHSLLTKDCISRFESDISKASLVFVDGNIPADSIQYVCETCCDHGVPVWFDPTDVSKALKAFSSGVPLSFISPNYNELRTIHESLVGRTDSGLDLSNSALVDVVNDARRMVLPLLDVVPTIFASLSQHGLLVGLRSSQSGNAELLYYPACRPEQMTKKLVSVSGAGDCMTVATIACLMRGLDLDTAVKAGLLAAQVSLQHFAAVPSVLSQHLFTLDKIHDWAPWDALNLTDGVAKLMRAK